ncbi:MAG: hypothetical protein K1X88_02300 [Nannocystaceae bacterium]|nr:hypothetical protein [Nannocystaceae bacterium]
MVDEGGDQLERDPLDRQPWLRMPLTRWRVRPPAALARAGEQVLAWLRGPKSTARPDAARAD